MIWSLRQSRSPSFDLIHTIVVFDGIGQIRSTVERPLVEDLATCHANIPLVTVVARDWGLLVFLDNFVLL